MTNKITEDLLRAVHEKLESDNAQAEITKAHIAGQQLLGHRLDSFDAHFKAMLEHEKEVMIQESLRIIEQSMLKLTQEYQAFGDSIRPTLTQNIGNLNRQLVTFES